MERLYGDSSVSRKLKERAFNILSSIHGHLYFPTYSNGLKDIASYLGFQWSAKDDSGIQSIVWRYKWERTNEVQFKRNLIAYNHEDCEALRLQGHYFQSKSHLRLTNLAGIKWLLSNTKQRKTYEI